MIVFFIGSYMGAIFETPPEFQPVWWVLMHAVFLALNIVGVELSFKVTLVVTLAALAVLVVALYNPVSRTRQTLLNDARDILLRHRPRDTPVLLASNLGRPQEQLAYRRLADLKVNEVDMLTVLLIGSSQSRIVERGEGPRFYTPRGYAKKVMA